MSHVRLETALSMAADFKFAEVSSHTVPTAVASPPPSLGPLVAFTGTFRGSGFNTIFRPDNAKTPTPLPAPVSGSDNVLELNLTEETLSFSPPLGSVPNRGEIEGDIFLNGVPYLQVIKDVTVPGSPVGIHFEPGLWMAVPAATDPAGKATLARMASIPHGTTIQAQGTSFTITGKPDILPIGITPFVTGQPANLVPFPSQTASNSDTPRIPQDLNHFIATGTITQAMLTDPTALLRNHIASQDIISTTVISISTDPAPPLFGGGTDNIAFLLGNPGASTPNAQALKMEATFWIETVEYTIQVAAFDPSEQLLVTPADTEADGGPVPEFFIDAPFPITAPRTIKAIATQIQYAQQVFLNFNGLTWPHVSVATLVPASPVTVPVSA